MSPPAAPSRISTVGQCQKYDFFSGYLSFSFTIHFDREGAETVRCENANFQLFSIGWYFHAIPSAPAVPVSTKGPRIARAIHSSMSKSKVRLPNYHVFHTPSTPFLPRHHTKANHLQRLKERVKEQNPSKYLKIEGNFVSHIR